MILTIVKVLKILFFRRHIAFKLLLLMKTLIKELKKIIDIHFYLNILINNIYKFILINVNFLVKHFNFPFRYLFLFLH